ncbi:kinase-like domain-containing protein [Plectosphaerella plurivora]|uniref:Kinase-like domain-containing protein n=1 Tax=Plectosphaerella plurivora TaxID=936078 RepID=A0A9P8VE26_9PEZI|nr:kinase-like domain-containing protein [Plectosphaerella plurivora]
MTLTDPRKVAEIMLSWLDLQLVTCVELQSLWAGYGHICAITARPSKTGTSYHPKELILKLIAPPGNPRAMDEGHLRKMLSYEVEQVFYRDIAPSLGPDAAVAECLASTANMHGLPRAEELHGLTATLMTDLRPAFPVAGEKRAVLSDRQVYAAIGWLASFHRQSWETPRGELIRYLLPPIEEEERRRTGTTRGDKLWLNGGYTYLATRRKEYGSLLRDRSSEWSHAFCDPFEDLNMSLAEAVATFLTPRGRPYETLIHGDVKSENLFTTTSGDAVAFFDFQYVGLGLGACDLAKLFTCSVPFSMLTDCPSLPARLPMGDGEADLLRRYNDSLLGGGQQYAWEEFVRHWETALVDWCRFQASWGFWGNTEWLEARTRHVLADEGWRTWLRGEVNGEDKGEGVEER